MSPRNPLETMEKNEHEEVPFLPPRPISNSSSKQSNKNNNNIATSTAHKFNSQKAFFVTTGSLVAFILVATLSILPVFCHVNYDGLASIPFGQNRGETADDCVATSELAKAVSILGERNSGTTWMTNEMRRCFGDVLQVKSNLTRHKHWFQHQNDVPHNTTIVISQFRNPYIWIAAMMDKPRHTPVHRNLDWRTYLTTPWTMPREKSDYDLLEKHHQKSIKDGTNATLVNAHGAFTKEICKQQFQFHEIVSCAFRPGTKEYHFDGRQRKPYYEMRNDGSGIPYGSVLDMRADKIRNHIQTVATFPFVKEVIVIQYEELLRRGTKFLIDRVEELSGVKAHCEPTPSQDRPQRSVDEKMVAYMNNYVDWEAEALIGYSKWEV